MITGGKNFRAAFAIGVLGLSLHTPVIRAENVLDGVAAMIAASNGIVVPAIAAAAEKSIAQTNAATSIYLNTLAAQTQAMAVAANTSTAMFNTLATMRIASMNNQLSLEQTYLQTAFQAWDRNLNYQLRREQMAADNYFKTRELDLKATLARAEHIEQMARIESAKRESGVSTGLQPIRTISSLNVSSVAQRNPVASSNLLSLGGLARANRQQSLAPKGLLPRAKALGKAFKDLAGLAGGSSRTDKSRWDTARFLASNPKTLSTSLPLHQSNRAIRASEATHSEENGRVLRPSAASAP